MYRKLLTFAVAAAMASPITAQATLYDFTFTLDQAQEIAASVPGGGPGKRVSVPGPSGAFGAGFARYDDVTNKFTFLTVSGTGLLGAIVDQHIHIGAPGVSGGIALNMPAPVFNTNGSFWIFGSNIGGTAPPDDRTTLNNAEEAALLAGNAYFNIHTTFDRAGEIRGQMIPATVVPEAETYALMLAGLGIVGWVARRRKLV